MLTQYCLDLLPAGHSRQMGAASQQLGTRVSEAEVSQCDLSPPVADVTLVSSLTSQLFLSKGLEVR